MNQQDARPLRILHVINDLGGAGGAERQLALNIAALNHDRFESYVCYLYSRSDLVEELRSLGVQVLHLDVHGKPQWPNAVWRLARAIRENRIDLVHANLFESELLAGIAGRIAGVPVISSLVNSADDAAVFSESLHPNRFKFTIARMLTKTVYRTCYRHFVALSDHVRQSSIEHLGISSKKITVIPRAVDKTWLEPESLSVVQRVRTELRLNGTYPLLLTIGRLVPQKGQKYLLSAMPRVLGAFPSAKLLIVGDGFMAEELKRLAHTLGIERAVSFLGRSSHVKELLATSDIFVFPSLWEGFGVSLLQAAALGKPCVACAVGPIPEFMENGKSGILVKPKSPEALADSIIELSENKEKAGSLGRQARQIVLGNFIIDRTVKKLESLYLELLEARRN